MMQGGTRAIGCPNAIMIGTISGRPPGGLVMESGTGLLGGGRFDQG
jgi:hypothetical protein